MLYLFPKVILSRGFWARLFSAGSTHGHKAVLGFLGEKGFAKSEKNIQKVGGKKRFPVISDELCKESSGGDPATFRDVLQFLGLSSQSHLCCLLHPHLGSTKHPLGALGSTRNVNL